MTLDHTTLRLPVDLMEKIEFYKNNSGQGFTSKSEVVKAALREFFLKNGIDNQTQKEGDGR